MKILKENDFKRVKDFFVIEGEKINVVFSNAEDNRSFSRHTETGLIALESIKNDFDVDKVVYIQQIHSDVVYNYRTNHKEFLDNEGDGIITDMVNTAIGVFTADCVSVILVDEIEGVISAVHSGWRGTIESIATKSLLKMVNEYNVKPKNVKVYIGPHIKQCCYEISEELKQTFLQKVNISESEIFNGRNLSMEKIIENDLLNSGVEEDNICLLDFCTFCNTDEKLFSYRKSNGSYGRMFSFAYIKGGE